LQRRRQRQSQQTPLATKVNSSAVAALVLQTRASPSIVTCSLVITHTAMITVVCLALLIFSRIERQVRSAIRAQGRTTGAGLYAGQPAVPTTRLIFQALTGLRLIPATSANPHAIPRPTPLQLEILDLLDVNPLQWC
jgi:hypothetical protein